MSASDIIKNAIASGTRELIRKKGVDDITVTEICESSGINRRTFYRYFRDKFDVVDWIYYNDALVHFDHYDGWSIYDYMPRIMESLYSDRRYYVNALSYRGQNSFRDFCTVCLKKLITADYENTFRSQQQLDFFISHLCEMTYDACIEWLSSEPCMSPTEFSAEYGDFLIRAFSTSAQLLLRTPIPGTREIEIKHAEPSRKSRKSEQ